MGDLPVRPTCHDCPAPAQGKDGFCKTCRVVRWAETTRKYPWTEAMDERLRRIYRTSRNRREFSANVNDLVKLYRMPRYIVSNRAVTLGLKMFSQNLWTKQDVETLLEFAGTMSLTKLAQKLHRSEPSIKCKLHAMQVSAQRSEGYSFSELGRLMGVGHNKISGWVGRGWLETEDGRVTQESVERFVWDRMQEFRFANCEEWWLKQTLRDGRLSKLRFGSTREEVAA